MKHAELWRLCPPPLEIERSLSLSLSLSCFFPIYHLQTDLLASSQADASNQTWNHSVVFAARLDYVAFAVIGINTASAGAPPH